MIRFIHPMLYSTMGMCKNHPTFTMENVNTLFVEQANMCKRQKGNVTHFKS